LDINAQVVNVEHDIQIDKNGGGTYPGTRLTYRADGKVQEQAWHEKALKFTPAVAKMLKTLQPGDNIKISKIKNTESGYWQVTAIVKGNGVPQESNDSTPSVSNARSGAKGSWETPEERAARQVMIVRQSSLSTAQALLAANGGKKNSPADVISAAKEFEAYVMGTNFDDGSIDTIQNSSEFNID